MKALAEQVTGRLHFTLEQVQDLTPTPMTLSSVMFWTGRNPYTGQEVFVARSQEEKRRQKSWFFARPGLNGEWASKESAHRDTPPGRAARPATRPDPKAAPDRWRSSRPSRKSKKSDSGRNGR